MSDLAISVELLSEIDLGGIIPVKYEQPVINSSV